MVRRQISWMFRAGMPLGVWRRLDEGRQEVSGDAVRAQSTMRSSVGRRNWWVSSSAGVGIVVVLLWSADVFVSGDDAAVASGLFEAAQGAALKVAAPTHFPRPQRL